MYQSTELPFRHVNFDSPQSIEVSKLTSPAFIEGNAQEIQIYIRLQCPNVQKPAFITPFVKPKSRNIWKYRFLACFKPSLEENESSIRNTTTNIFSQWSQFVEFKDAVLKGDWFRIPNSQQPSNGQIWMRVSQHRICLMILICITSNHLEKTVAPSGSSAAFSSTSSFSFHNQSVESFRNLFPATYYYWDSGQIKPGFDTIRSRISVTDDNVYLILAPIGDCSNLSWIDRDIALLQQTCNHIACYSPIEVDRQVNRRPSIESSEKMHQQHDAKTMEHDVQSDTESQHASIAVDSNFAEFERLEREVEAQEAAVPSSKPDPWPLPAAATPPAIPSVLIYEDDIDISKSKKLKQDKSSSELVVEKKCALSTILIDSNLLQHNPGTVALPQAEDEHQSLIQVERGISPIRDGNCDLFEPIRKQNSEHPSPQGDSLGVENRWVSTSRLQKEGVYTTEDPTEEDVVEENQPTTETEDANGRKTGNQFPAKAKQVQSRNSHVRTSNSQIPIRSHYREAGDNRTSRQPSAERQQYHNHHQNNSITSISESKGSQTTVTYTDTITTNSVLSQHRDKERSRENQEEPKQIHRRRRRRSEPRGKTIKLTDCLSDQLEGLDVIRSKLESMTDEQWNLVLDILNGRPDNRAPVSNEARVYNTRELSPRPRKPRAANSDNLCAKNNKISCTQGVTCRVRRI